MIAKRELLAWTVALVLAAAVAYQYLGYTKALAKAEAAEQTAKQAVADLQSVRAERIKADALAQQQLAALDTRISQYEAILAKGSKAKPITRTQSPASNVSPTLGGVSTVPSPSYGPSKQWPDVCDAFQQADGSPLIIGSYQVYVCGMSSYVEAQAAIDLVKAGGELEALHTKYDGALKELQASNDALQKVQLEAGAYKKAAKKSGVKRFFGVVSKVAIFAGGIALGHVIR